VCTPVLAEFARTIVSVGWDSNQPVWVLVPRCGTAVPIVGYGYKQPPTSERYLSVVVWRHRRWVTNQADLQKEKNSLLN